MKQQYSMLDENPDQDYLSGLELRLARFTLPLDFNSFMAVEMQYHDEYMCRRSTIKRGAAGDN